VAEYVNRHKADVAAVTAAYDELVARIEVMIKHLEEEHPAAKATGDYRYAYRVERGLAWSRALLDVIDDSAHVVDGSLQQRLMDLRHNAHQLGIAHDGKLV
jgi:hypothetical protein